MHGVMWGCRRLLAQTLGGGEEACFGGSWGLWYSHRSCFKRFGRSKNRASTSLVSLGMHPEKRSDESFKRAQ